MAEEQTFLEENGVRVTNARLVTPDSTYAMSGVVSVAFRAEIASRLGPTLLALLGSCLIGLAVLNASLSSDLHPGIGGLAAGVVPFVFAIAWWVMQESNYAVVLRNASGEVKAHKSKDKAHIERVVAAVNNAMIARG